MLIFFQNWEGEKFAYECKNKMLFQVSESTGLRYKTAECKSVGLIQPWWSINKMGGLCKSGLREGISLQKYCNLCLHLSNCPL